MVFASADSFIVPYTTLFGDAFDGIYNLLLTLNVLCLHVIT